uniref:Uncharacterized protein n=1 Tax=Arundo donax TaxID=35708 RepID=A0A0A9AAA2_ARUDO
MPPRPGPAIVADDGDAMATPPPPLRASLHFRRVRRLGRRRHGEWSGGGEERSEEGGKGEGEKYFPMRKYAIKA